MFKYLTKILIICLGLIFVVSILANLLAWPFLIAPLFIFACALFALLCYFSLDYALYFLIAELVLGGAGGRWLYFGPLSIRIALLSILVFFWIVALWRKKINLSFLKQNLIARMILILAFFFPIFWSILGWIYGWPLQYIFADANGFIFYFIFIILITVLPRSGQLKKIVVVYLSAIFLVSIIITILYFISVAGIINIWFLKQFFLGRLNYGGKIGIMPDGAYRLFTGNGVFVQIGLLIFASLILLKDKLNQKQKIILSLAILFSYLAIIASYTRGFWLGIIIAAIFLFFWLSWRARAKMLSGAVVLFIVSELIFQGLFHLSFFNFFFNRLATSVSIEKDPVSLGERVSQVRVLGGSILRNPFWGTGFGTYFPSYRTEIQVSDPYSFELGYLDMVVKFGIVGFAFWGTVILFIFFKGLKILIYRFDLPIKEKAIILGFLSGLIALLVVGGTSPFLMSAFGITHIVLTLYLLEVIDRQLTQNSKLKITISK